MGPPGGFSMELGFVGPLGRFLDVFGAPFGRLSGVSRASLGRLWGVVRRVSRHLCDVSGGVWHKVGGHGEARGFKAMSCLFHLSCVHFSSHSKSFQSLNLAHL